MKPDSDTISLILLTLLVFPQLCWSNEEVEDTDDINESESVLSLKYESHHHGLAADEAENLASPEFTAEVELKRSYRFSRPLVGLVDISLVSEQNKFEQDFPTRRDEYAVVDQYWLQWSANAEESLSFRIGRQDIADDEGWWWDEEMDALTIRGSTERTEYTTGLAQGSDAPRTHALPEDPELENIDWLIGSLQFTPGEMTQWDFNLAARQDRSSRYLPGQTLKSARIDESDDELVWLGLQWRQAFIVGGGHRLELQSLGAVMRGTLSTLILEDEEDLEESNDEENTDTDTDTDDAGRFDSENQSTVLTQNSVSAEAWAISTWLHWTPARLSDHTLSFGYSVGSGTGSGRAKGSGTFQQTGLHSNEIDHHYYGEILEPELSNLRIATVQLRGSVIPNLRYALSHHRYFRDSIHDDTFEAELDIELNAGSRKLGHETRLSIEFEPGNDLKTEVSIARLITGELIDSNRRESIDHIAVEVSYEF